jgi:hypothetical protein
MFDVLLTVDTEFRPATASREQARDHFARCVLGRHRQGAHGIGYQIEVLNAHGLKGVFFVEALHAAVLGDELLARTIDLVRSAGHEVQLRIHPEWLVAWPNNPFGVRQGRNMCDLDEDIQTGLVELGLEAMARCGEHGIRAFRAGNHAANETTLRALERVGIACDSSYLQPTIAPEGAMRIDPPLESPARIGGVWEVPVTHFHVHRQHVRPLRIAACSFAEMEAVLTTARIAGRRNAVVTCYSHELMNPSRTRPDPVIVNRFGQLCRFLEARASQGFRTTGFDGLSLVETDAQALPIRSNPVRTGARMAEQMVSRLYQ